MANQSITIDPRSLIYVVPAVVDEDNKVTGKGVQIAMTLEQFAEVIKPLVASTPLTP